MVRVLLCGAAGWTGRAILKELLSDSSYTTIIAFDVRPESWDAWADVDGPAPDASSRVALRYGDMADFDIVEALVQDSDVIIHTSVFFPNPQATGEFSTGDVEQDEKGWLVNLKGLWNLLECAVRNNVRRVVHMGSCSTSHPTQFSSSEVRRSDGALYAVYKRLQEEMCRQFFEAFQLPIVVLRPAYIVDIGKKLGRGKETLSEISESWIDRTQLAVACRRGIEEPSPDGRQDFDFDVLHVATLPVPPVAGVADVRQTCNVERTQRVLGVSFEMDLGSLFPASTTAKL